MTDKAGTVRWWIGTDDDPDKREQIVVTAKDAAKQPNRGDVTAFTVKNLLTGKHVKLRRADCGLGCQYALERA
jgi:hypothetical protein